jgi:hypothetical protein
MHYAFRVPHLGPRVTGVPGSAPHGAQREPADSLLAGCDRRNRRQSNAARPLIGGLHAVRRTQVAVKPPRRARGSAAPTPWPRASSQHGSALGRSAAAKKITYSSGMLAWPMKTMTPSAPSAAALTTDTDAIASLRSVRSTTAPLGSANSIQGSCCATISPATWTGLRVIDTASRGPAIWVTPSPSPATVAALQSLPNSRPSFLSVPGTLRYWDLPQGQGQGPLHGQTRT